MAAVPCALLASCQSFFNRYLKEAHSHRHCSEISKFSMLFRLFVQTSPEDGARLEFSPKLHLCASSENSDCNAQGFGELPCMYTVALASIRESSLTLPQSRKTQRSPKNSVDKAHPPLSTLFFGDSRKIRAFFRPPRSAFSGNEAV